MEAIRNKLANLKGLIRMLDAVKDEYANNRANWELVRLSHKSPRGDAIEQAKSELLSTRDDIRKYESLLLDVTGTDDITEARAAFSNLAEHFNFVLELESTLQKRIFWLNVLAETQTVPVDWDEKENGAFSLGREIAKNDTMAKQLEAAYNALKTMADKVKCEDVSALVTSAPTIQIAAR